MILLFCFPLSHLFAVACELKPFGPGMRRRVGVLVRDVAEQQPYTSVEIEVGYHG